MSDSLIEKVVTTDAVQDGNPIGTGGLTYAQADRFIDYMWDSTVLSSLVTQRRMRATEEEIDTIAVGTRLTVGATEAVDTGANVEPTWGKLSITVKKFRLDWELSSESLEDNIEGDALEDHIARMLATQMGNDLEDYFINGDTASGVAGVRVQDGIRKRAINGGHVVDAAGATLSRTVLKNGLAAMPRKYMQKRPELRFFTGSNAILDYLFSVQQVDAGLTTLWQRAAAGINQAVTPEGPAGFLTDGGFAVPIQEVPLFLEDRQGDYDTNSGVSGVQLPSSNVGHTDLWLTFPKNMIWGVKRDIKVYREFRPKKDTVEYTVYCRQGNQIENLDAFVVVKNVKVS